VRGATFRCASTLSEGLRLVAEAGPFALAVVDLMLPDGDGTDVVRAMKERWPETPVCVLSSVRDLSGALQAGADEAIGKETPPAVDRGDPRAPGLGRRGPDGEVTREDQPRLRASVTPLAACRSSEGTLAATQVPCLGNRGRALRC